MADDQFEEQHDAPAPRQSFLIPAKNLPQVEHRIEIANRRLARAGLNDRFEYTAVEKLVPDDQGFMHRRFEVELNRPRIGFDGWSFTGVHQFTADGKGVASFLTGRDYENAPEVQTPTDQSCDHCGKNRQRGAIYTLRNESGDQKQVGKSCLAAFLGIAPAGLWALEYELDEDEFTDEVHDGDDGGPGINSDSIVVPAEDLLVAALAASADGTEFISRSRADRENPATAEAVIGSFSTLLSAGDTPARRRAARELLGWLNEQTLDPEDGTGYMANLKEVIAGDDRWVSRRHIPLAISVIAARRAADERALKRKLREERKATLVREYVAAPGEKIEGIRATVLSTRYMNGYTPGSYTTLVKLIDERGRSITWFASDMKQFDDGQEVIVRGTVKKNEEFNDEFQTAITRAKLTDPETGEKLGDFD